MAKKNYGLGRKHSPDERDKNFLMRRLLPPAAEVELPTRKTWAITPKNLDQGSTGTCVGMSWANFLRCAPIQSKAGVNEEYAFKIYDEAIKIDEWSDNDVDPERQFGSSVRAGAEAVLKFGRLKSYLWAFNLQPVVEWVLTQGPVVLGTNWYSSMFYPDKEGIITITPRASIAGGHAYLLRGVDTKRALASISNSWGDDWGLSGNALLPFRDLERLIHEDGEAATAVENRLKPKAL